MQCEACRKQVEDDVDLQQQARELLDRAAEAEGFLDRFFAPAPLTVFGVDIRAAVCLLAGGIFAGAAVFVVMH